MAIKIEKGKIPIWEKYMLTVDEAVQYFGIGEKKNKDAYFGTSKFRMLLYSPGGV